MQREWLFPSIACRWEDPDSFVSRVIRSELDLESSQGMLALFLELVSRTGYLYWLFDLGVWESATPELRNSVQDLNLSTTRFTMVIHGGTFVARTSMSLGLRALTLLGRANVEPVMLPDESEARAWVNAHRRQRHAAK